MTTLRRFLLSLPILAGLIGLAAGCSHDTVVLRPAVYGDPGHCYYVQSPLEAQALIADGLCQPGWAPTLAPSAWTYAYASYLFAPNSFYMTHYVPVGNRVNYASYSTTYVTVHAADIDRAKKDTNSPYKYKDPSGKTYTAAKADSSKGTFGGGTRTGFGGGNRKSASVANTNSNSGTAQSNTQRSSSNNRTSSGSKSSGSSKSGKTK